MKNILKISLIAAVLSVAAANVNAQVILTPTTLSTSITSGSQRTMTVTSATPNAVTAQNFAAGTSAYIDRELVTVTAVSGTTISIIRGQGGTFAAPHTSGVYVFSAQPQLISASYKQGRCVRSSEIVLPVIDAKDGIIFDCLNSQWEQGDITGGTQVSARFRVVNQDSGGTAYSSLNSTGTTLAATTMYCTEINLPTNKLVTGIALLNGTTVGTDKHLVALYDAGGTLLANSATAGATTSGASTFQQFALTTPYFAVGPAQYFACFQTNGTTDTVRMAVTGTQDNILTKGQTASTFGTLPALTVPTTFTTAVGPYSYIY